MVSTAKVRLCGGRQLSSKVGKGVTPYPLSTQNMYQCVLVPSVNQSLAKKGLAVDCIVLNHQEFNSLAARLNFQPQHRSCKHSNMHFQRSVDTRIWYVVLQPNKTGVNQMEIGEQAGSLIQPS